MLPIPKWIFKLLRLYDKEGPVLRPASHTMSPDPSPTKYPLTRLYPQIRQSAYAFHSIGRRRGI